MGLISRRRRRILAALLKGDSYGLELSQLTGLTTGWMYPSLRAMEREGWLESYESEPMDNRGRLPRVYYRITELGKQKLVGDS